MDKNKLEAGFIPASFLRGENMEKYIAGRNAVLEMLKSGQEIEKIYIQSGEKKGSINQVIGKAKANKILVVEASTQKLDELSEGQVHQGVVAFVSDYKYYDLEEIIAEERAMGKNIRLVILDEIEDPHNLGAIIRTCEVAGFSGLIIPKRRSAQVNATVHKSSAGATAYLKIAKVTNIAETISKLKEENIWVYGADGEAENLYTDTDFKGDICLVIGNEGKGMTRLVKERCDGLVKLPMYGKVSSLNASNALAVLVYEVLRQNA